MNDGGLKRCDASGKTFHTGLKKNTAQVGRAVFENVLLKSSTSSLDSATH